MQILYLDIDANDPKLNTSLISIAATIKRTLPESLQAFLESKLPTYSIIAFFIASRLFDVTLLVFDVNIYIELEDIFAIDLYGSL